MSSYQRPAMRVLVVDDHELTRFTLKVALSDQPNLTLIGLASNGEEAIAMTRQYLPDVVILDLQMPVMDGFTACVQIKAIAPSTQIIAYSSLEEGQAKAMNKNSCCIDAFCRKEASTKVLVGLVNRLVQNSLTQRR